MNLYLIPQLLTLLAICVSAASPLKASDVPESKLLRKPAMYYTDTSFGRAFAKDPDVAYFKDRYLMYYTTHRGKKGIAIGIAESSDLEHWTKVGDILPAAEYEKKGLGAPGAIVLRGQVHLFYQSYGNGPKDAICHAVSDDGIHFVRNETNPIFRPTGAWNCGRAIDADVIEHKDRLLLYCATRDPQMKVQMIAVAAAPLHSSYNSDCWTQLCDESILKPELPWEKKCIEASTICKHKDRLYMFYAGAYNNQPQQVGCAVSDDGIRWERLSKFPLLPNGRDGEWNSSESGHPGVFEDDDGQQYLFFQGNNNKGKTWYLSKMKVGWEDDKPILIRPGDGWIFRLKE